MPAQFRGSDAWWGTNTKLKFHVTAGGRPRDLAADIRAKHDLIMAPDVSCVMVSTMCNGLCQELKDRFEFLGEPIGYEEEVTDLIRLIASYPKEKRFVLALAGSGKAWSYENWAGWAAVARKYQSIAFQHGVACTLLEEWTETMEVHHDKMHFVRSEENVRRMSELYTLVIRLMFALYPGSDYEAHVVKCLGLPAVPLNVGSNVTGRRLLSDVRPTVAAADAVTSTCFATPTYVGAAEQASLVPPPPPQGPPPKGARGLPPPPPDSEKPPPPKAPPPAHLLKQPPPPAGPPQGQVAQSVGEGTARSDAWIAWKAAGEALEQTPAPGTPDDFDKVFPEASRPETQEQAEKSAAVAAEVKAEASGEATGWRQLSGDADAEAQPSAVAAANDLPYGPGKEYEFKYEYDVVQSDAAREAAAAAAKAATQTLPPAQSASASVDPFAVMGGDNAEEWRLRKREADAAQSAEEVHAAAIARQEEKRPRVAPQSEKRTREAVPMEEEDSAVPAASPKATSAYIAFGSVEPASPFLPPAASPVAPDSATGWRQLSGGGGSDQEMLPTAVPSSPRMTLSSTASLVKVGAKRQRWADMGDDAAPLVEVAYPPAEAAPAASVGAAVASSVAVKRMQGLGPFDEEVLVPLGVSLPLLVKEELDPDYDVLTAVSEAAPVIVDEQPIDADAYEEVEPPGKEYTLEDCAEIREQARELLRVQDTQAFGEFVIIVTDYKCSLCAEVFPTGSRLRAAVSKLHGTSHVLPAGP